eukprot:g45878.t1
MTYSPNCTLPLSFFHTYGHKYVKRWEVMLRLYKTLVRPLLEDYVQFWLSSYRKDIIKLDKVQERFTWILSVLKGLNYKERLDRLGLFSLECRRLRGDLMRGIDRFD